MSTYTWDYANRLKQVQNGANTYNLTYDATGRRVSKTGPATTEYYHYSGNKVAYVSDASGSIIQIFTYDGMGRPLYLHQNGTLYQYHYNGRGDVIKLTDMNQANVADYQYDAFGNITAKSGSMADSNPYRYAGYWYDKETGLYSLNARYYKPDTGRFISQDTYKGSPRQPGTQNLYTYVGNNPINYVDPTGHMPQSWWQARGADFENTFGQVTDAVKNGRLFDSLTEGRRRPDFFLGEEWLVELKNAGRQSWRSQLQGLQEIAGDLDRRFLLVGNDITQFSKRTIGNIQEGGGRIIRMTQDGTFLTVTGEVITDLATFLGNSVEVAPMFMFEDIWEKFQRDMYPDLST